MRARWSCVKGVMCERGGSHVKRMITCEPGCGCENGVWSCERVRSNGAGHVWTGWSRMNGVVTYEWGVVV